MNNRSHKKLYILVGILVIILLAVIFTMIKSYRIADAFESASYKYESDGIKISTYNDSDSTRIKILLNGKEYDYSFETYHPGTKISADFSAVESSDDSESAIINFKAYMLLPKRIRLHCTYVSSDILELKDIEGKTFVLTQE